ncbi:E3 ubiquitin-protein ligase TRIM21-like [Hippoglossus hippoglossus]|uniref:E3 ubiquitin-protein ligase TRIM21-like n=1 Tax=Hippoglossus hippoglossus TaxID=8267 RepID=UPI00148D453C|nr:E3 ubiquitin-protein ligase TRIM21-like [Hippoglossus hippoglossus]
MLRSISPRTHTDMASALSSEQFRCCICLDCFKNPTSIPCGHNFCLDCIKRFWDTRHKSVCPICKEVFKTRPELRINVGLREITNNFVRSRKNKAKHKPILKQLSEPDVSCDSCHGDKSPAVKSCLDCQKSFCESHLAPHSREPVLTKHRLTVPGANVHLCGNHHKLLEMFCKDDQTPVCVKCVAKDHRRHNTVPIEKESKRIKTQIRKTEAEFQQMIRTRIKKVEEIRTSVELCKTQTDREIQTSVQVFTMVIGAIERNQALLIEEIEQKQEAAEKRAEELLEELEQEVEELQRRRGELQLLEITEDPFRLLHCFPPLSTPLPSRDWSQVGVSADICIGTVRRAFSKLLDTCHDLEKKLSSDEMSKISQHAVDVTLDPVTASSWLILSADGKKVSLSSQRRPSLPDAPRRFDSCVSVLGEQSFTSGRRYWEVQVGDKTDWDLGVAKESINTKGVVTVRPDSGYWAICRRKGGSLSACTSPCVTLHLQETPQKVGIFLDYEDGSVSFYDSDAKTHIYTYSWCPFTEPLYPYFNPCLHDNGKNTAPLVICPVD